MLGLRLGLYHNLFLSRTIGKFPSEIGSSFLLTSTFLRTLTVDGAASKKEAFFFITQHSTTLKTHTHTHTPSIAYTPECYCGAASR